jgi:hypothetical protein
MWLRRARHRLACLSTLIVQCGAPAPGPFGPAELPETRQFTLIATPNANLLVVASVNLFPDGRVFAEGTLRGGVAGVTYVMHFHPGGCGSEALTFESGPTISYLSISSGVAEANFPAVEVPRDIIGGGWVADVHRVGTPTLVLACGRLG